MNRSLADAKHTAHLIRVNPFRRFLVPYLLFLASEKSLQPFHAFRPFNESALVDDYYSFHTGHFFV